MQKTFSQHSNIRFIYSDAKANLAIQIMQIEDFIHNKVDLLMVSPYVDNATTEAVAKAYRSGIPVVLVGRMVSHGDEYTSYLHPDNKKIARDAARYLVKKIADKGKVLLLKGVPKASTTRERTEGFYDVVSQYPDIKVIERTANYLRRDAIIEVEKLLGQGERFDAVMSQSDSMLIGARMAFKAHSIDPASLVTVGIDYIKPAQEAIRSGQQDSSFVYSLSARESAEAAVKILSGEKVPKEIIIETQQVTQENVDVVTPIF
ncbi:MAG: substrate-binding domain-containing protein [gamma proteobacterium symbiont of Lucinoma myriamae]|nr:substrate-binding domain-containing protein [gamma proteobacterium symbiont of Lucinoma myriamae]MCU7832518.1 substrate-binding domain-containing protein [gamma proteobacterium symbiont of Lucinoma myriamae]